MARVWLFSIVVAAAVALCAPLSAQARTPCPSESVVTTAANAADVSDAIVCLSNQIRAHFGLPALTRDARLDSAARLHSADMDARGFFDHTNPDGLTPGNRASAQGYTLGVGENIAVGYPTARATVLGWMQSTGHCQNLLSAARDVGVGTSNASRPYYTQMFGDYFSRPIDETARNACPYTLNLDTLEDAAAPAIPPAIPPAAPAAQAYGAKGTPALRLLALSPRRLRAGRRGTISYTLSAPATVTFRVQRATGHGGFRTLSGRFTDAGVVGVNTVRFSGRIGRRTLHPGRYRLQAVARDVLGKTSPLVRSSFEIVRRAAGRA